MTYEERLQLFRTNVGFALPNDVERKLDELGFFNAPASMKYHLSYEGGLFEHSMNVAMSLLDISCKLQLTWQRSISPFVIGIFHDLCKCDLYKSSLTEHTSTMLMLILVTVSNLLKLLERLWISLMKKLHVLNITWAHSLKKTNGKHTHLQFRSMRMFYGHIQLTCILRRYSRVNLMISDELSFLYSNERR